MTKKKKKSAKSGRRTTASGRRPALPAAFEPALLAVTEWAKRNNYDAALIGGVAVSLHGPVRPTDDIDVVVITTQNPEQVLASLQASGFKARFSDPVEFAVTTRVLLMTHAASGVKVDVLLGMIPFELESMRRSAMIPIGRAKVRVFPVESLCVMKIVAGRPHDLRDVAQLIAGSTNLDRKWVMEQVANWAELMEQPEVLERARGLLEDND